MREDGDCFLRLFSREEGVFCVRSSKTSRFFLHFLEFLESVQTRKRIDSQKYSGTLTKNNSFRVQDHPSWHLFSRREGR
ncbi:hypothetical protein LptCag_0900 [Leptospirillum ferriphilum]|uniref:Uncharacterized protein n=1 Tax=Leptospirillum ferriphilum TaxID=178606 RepID=A0A094W985_9BACT|nr:hypothetical protein LptCag_0900 [Leptospirillum ferriphilum]